MSQNLSNVGPAGPQGFPAPIGVISKYIPDCSVLTTAASPVNLFTVTGDVVLRVYATVQTALTSASSNGTLAVGVSGATTFLLGAVTVDGTNLHTAGGTWTGATSSAGAGTTTGSVFSNTALNWALVSAGSTTSNIILTIGTNNMTAGAITFYCQWYPASTNGSVVPA